MSGPEQAGALLETGEEAGSARELGKRMSRGGSKCWGAPGCAEGGQGWMGPMSRSSHSWEQRREKQNSPVPTRRASGKGELV